MTPVQLLGLDFGTTTSSAVIGSALLLHNSVTGRTELSQVVERFRAEMVFTPLKGDELDLAKVEDDLRDWLAAGNVRAADLFGGGALLTGLTAQKNNADALIGLIRRYVGQALIARADDPCLESWLAFMGSCASLSRKHPQTWFLNLDIGGGTTNLALGRNGEVFATGCLFVGARHIQVVPGTYQIVHLSSYARRLLAHLGMVKEPGQELLPNELTSVLDYYLRLLHAAATCENEVLNDPMAQLLQQVPFRPGAYAAEFGQTVVTLSGGVGALVYAAIQGKPLPATTFYGDLGIDLAERLLQSVWADHFRSYLPEGGGRATVYGLLRHSTQISGSTIFLADANLLPLLDVPILGTLTDASPDNHVRHLVDLAKKTIHGGCLRMLPANSAAGVRTLGTRLADALEAEGFPTDMPLVVLTPGNLGKTLGHYVTRWGKRPLRLIVLDEIAIPDAQYVSVGEPREQVIPVSFFGLQK